MKDLPVHISLVFGLITFLTIGFFYRATNYSKSSIIILLSWLGLQTFIGIFDFYKVTNTSPPRFLVMILPPLLFIVGLFISPKGRQFIDSLDIKQLILIHTIRIPVEIVLYWLFMYKAVPEIMTFEGRNFDILSGITAPFIFYYGFIKRQIYGGIILIWNLISLGLLFNIIIHAILSTPFPFQMFAFDQPNIAVLYFPFNWLPSCIVPLVLFSHLVVIRKLINNR